MNTEVKQIREKVTMNELEGRNIIDVDVVPVIREENKTNNNVSYIGELELNFLISNSELNVETKNVKIPFEYSLDIDGIGNSNTELEIEVLSQNFVVQDGGNVNCNIDLQMNVDISRNININVIDEVQTAGKRDD